MFQREITIKRISDALAFLEVSTKNRGLLRLFDQHLLAETFAAKLLNIIYGYSLINLNTIDSTYAATDLGDFQQKLCFQVTYTILQNHRTKIENSISKFIKNELYTDFTWLRFLFLGPKQQTYNKPFDTQQLFQFDPCQDVINLQDLIKELPTLSIQQLKKLSNLIDEEFYEFTNSSVTSHTQNTAGSQPTHEVQTILDNIAYAINRGLIVKESHILSLQTYCEDFLTEQEPGLRNRLMTKFQHVYETIRIFNTLPRKPGRGDEVVQFVQTSDIVRTINSVRVLLGEYR